MRCNLHYMRCILHFMWCLSYYMHCFSYYMQCFVCYHYTRCFCRYMRCVLHYEVTIPRGLGKNFCKIHNAIDIFGQYKTWTTDYGLRTRNKLIWRVGYKTRTKHYGLGIKYGLRYKTRTEHYGLGNR